MASDAKAPHSQNRDGGREGLRVRRCGAQLDRRGPATFDSLSRLRRGVKRACRGLGASDHADYAAWQRYVVRSRRRVQSLGECLRGPRSRRAEPPQQMIAATPRNLKIKECSCAGGSALGLPRTAEAAVRSRLVPSLYVIKGQDRGRSSTSTRAHLAWSRRRRTRSALHDTEVSRRHAELRYDGSVCIVVDLDSSNGTYVNGRRVEDEQQLSSSDQVQVGGTLMLFTDPAEKPPDDLSDKVDIVPRGLRPTARGSSAR